MKTFKILAALVAALMLTAPALQAGEIKDNLGRTWVTDSETGKILGAGSGYGDLVSLEADSLPIYDRHMFDLSLGIGITGVASDDSSATEQALTGVTLFWYPASWVKLGPRMAWNPAVNNEVHFQTPVEFILWPDPFSKYILKLGLTPFTYTVRTGEVDGIPRDSAFSLNPEAAFKIEVPMGSYSIDAAFGVAMPFSIQGVTDEQLNQAVGQAVLGAGFAVTYRLR